MKISKILVFPVKFSLCLSFRFVCFVKYFSSFDYKLFGLQFEFHFKQSCCDGESIKCLFPEFLIKNKFSLTPLLR